MLIISLSGFASSFLNYSNIFVKILFGPHALSVRILLIMSSISSSHDTLERTYSHLVGQDNNERIFCLCLFMQKKYFEILETTLILGTVSFCRTKVTKVTVWCLLEDLMFTMVLVMASPCNGFLSSFLYHFFRL